MLFFNKVHLTNYFIKKTPLNKNQSICHEYLKKAYEKQHCHKTKILIHPQLEKIW